MTLVVRSGARLPTERNLAVAAGSGESRGSVPAPGGRIRPPRHRWFVAALVALAAALVAGPARAQSVSIIDGAVDPVELDAGGKPERWFRISVDSDRLVVIANGPIVLSVRMRAVKAGRAQGVLRIVRDYGPFSDTSYDLERDFDVQLPKDARAEKDATSKERVLHVQVPEGEHTYAFAPVRGPPLLLRVLKTSKLDPSLAPSPERNAAAVVERTPSRAAPEPKSEPRSEPILTPITQWPTQRRGPPELTIAPVRKQELDPVDESLRPARIEGPSRATPEPLPPRKGGPAIALHLGGAALLDVTGDGRESPGPQLGTGFEAVSSLELAWDLDPRLSLFASGGFGLGSATTKLGDGTTLSFGQRTMPIAVGLTYLFPLAEKWGLRLRLGGATAVVNAIPAASAVRQVMPFGAVAGLAGEYAAGPGKVLLELRYLLLRSESFVPAIRPWPFATEAGEAGGPQLLAGYRLDL